MAWLFKADWVASPRPPVAADLDSIAKDIRTWGGGVDAAQNNLSNLGVLTFGAGGYVNNSLYIWGPAGPADLKLQGDGLGLWWITADLSNKLQIGGYGGTRPTRGAITIQGDGNVGIGTASPTAPLQVASVAQVGDTPIQRWSYAGEEAKYNLLLRKNVASGLVKYAFDLTNDSTLYSNVLVLDRGNVGIGTASPYSKLSLGSAVGQRVALFEQADGQFCYGIAQLGDNTAASPYRLGVLSCGVEGLSVTDVGYVIRKAPASAVADANLPNGTYCVWFDEGGNRLVFRAKTSAGVLKAGYVNVS